MLKLVNTDSKNKDFQSLVKDLDAYLRVTDGDEHAFYSQFNNIDALNNVIVAYKNEKAIACGAFKQFTDSSVEIKRMYTVPEERGLGAAGQVLKALETWAKTLKFKRCILETGIRQIEAVQFYKKNGYQVIPNYGQYIGVKNSLCFEKELQ